MTCSTSCLLHPCVLEIQLNPAPLRATKPAEPFHTGSKWHILLVVLLDTVGKACTRYTAGTLPRPHTIVPASEHVGHSSSQCLQQLKAAEAFEMCSIRKNLICSSMIVPAVLKAAWQPQHCCRRTMRTVMLCNSSAAQLIYCATRLQKW